MMPTLIDGTDLKDVDVLKWRREIEKQWGVCFSKDMLEDAFLVESSEHSFHPVREYLDGLRWDGQDRIGAMLTHIIMAPEDALKSMMIRRWLCQAVRRVYRPGIQCDATLVLLSRKMGLRKTSFFKTLAEPTGDEWWASGAFDHADKDTLLKLHSSWICILDEMDEFLKNRDRAAYCTWLTEKMDLFRPPYGRRIGRHLRSLVFCGTTNDDQCLRDVHGTRRFWLIETEKRINTELLVEWRDQIWAQAKVLADSLDFQHWLSAEDDEARESAAAIYKPATELEDRVEAYCRDRDTINVAEMLSAVLNIPLAEALTHHREEAQARNALTRMRWRSVGLRTHTDEKGKTRQRREWVAPEGWLKEAGK
jgi:putative DNA primase/helicase